MIVITGITGQIGSRLAVNLLRQGEEVAGVALPKEHDEATAERLKKAGAKLYWADITEKDLSQILPEDNVSAIFHLAGIHSSMEKTRKLYVNGTKYVIEYAMKTGCPFMLVSSNSAVYGVDDLCKESEICHPTHPFGKITYEMEQMCYEFYKKHGLPVVIFRISEVYGTLNDEINSMRKHQIHLLGDGLNYTSHIHIDDLVQMLLLAKNRVKIGEIYNISDSQPVLQKEYYQYIAEKFGLQQPEWIQDQSPRILQSIHGLRSLSIQMSSKKVCSSLGYQLKYQTYKDGIDAVKQQIQDKEKEKGCEIIADSTK